MPKVPSVRVGPLVNLPGIVTSLGCDPTPIFRKSGFSLAQFSDTDNKIPFVTGSKLLANCVAETGAEHLGLLLGQASTPSHLGIAGYLLRVAPDVKTALNSLLDFLDLHDEGGVPTLDTKGKVTHLGYAIHEPHTEAIEQIYDLSIVMILNIMQGLCGKNWMPIEIFLMRQPPKDPSLFKKMFRVPVHYNAEFTAAAFPSYWLENPISFADSLLYAHLKQEAEELRATKDISLTTELRQLLRQCLMEDSCIIANIASQLGIHERTLNRRLKAEGTTFRQELENVRYTVSQQLLTATHASLDEISLSLGYSDSTAFHHAFKRWSGISPAQWRNAKEKQGH